MLALIVGVLGVGGAPAAAGAPAPNADRVFTCATPVIASGSVLTSSATAQRLAPGAPVPPAPTGEVCTVAPTQGLGAGWEAHGVGATVGAPGGSVGGAGPTDPAGEPPLGHLLGWLPTTRASTGALAIGGLVAFTIAFAALTRRRGGHVTLAEATPVSTR